MMMIRRIILVSILFTSVENQIYLYDTHDSPSTEYYDCIFVKSFYYCIRPKTPVSLARNDHIKFLCTINGGQLHNFSDLLNKNVSVSQILHQWKSSIELAEQYARYRNNRSETNGFICECSDQQSFGKYCEYRLPIMSSLQKIADWQQAMRRDNPWDVQMHGTMICYPGLSCDSGLLCLDWREICDGAQNCLSGNDESLCDLLEMNICADDEYRCMNGMCIPETYFLDGELDCLDWSDELRIKSSEDCPFESVSTVCDDHICYPTQWSCGDGQCIQDRLAFQKLGKKKSCTNLRDQYYLCETHLTVPMWTMPNGRCTGDKNYPINPTSNMTDTEICNYLLRCARFQAGETGCLSPRNCSYCTERVQKNCSLSEIRYPSGQILAPYIYLIFNTKRNSTRFIPDFIQIHNTNTRIPFDDNLNLRKLTEIYLPTSIQYQCYHSNESTNVCHQSIPCLSLTRLADGWNNCPNQTDEQNQTAIQIDQSCSRVRSHRFYCSSEQPTCLSVTALGNEWNDCRNRYDELLFGGNRRLSELNCNSDKKDDCDLVRNYIKESSSSSFLSNNATSISLGIPFRSYCDTFWNLAANIDENLARCKESWVCSEGEWQCRTGQCIDPIWRSDRERDCADGSDEEESLQNLTKWIQTQHPQPSEYFSSSCYKPSSFLCLSPPGSEQTRFTCVNLSDVGDGKIDCMGAIDERNTWEHCKDQSSMLGNHFLCRSNNQCISHFEHCSENKRCEHQEDDESWCERPPSTSECNHINDFRCFNGTCVINGRCNKKVECPATEDEFMCDFSSIEKRRVVPYREDKKISTRKRYRPIRLVSFPNQSNSTRSIVKDSNTTLALNVSSLNSSSLTWYWCNRGLGLFTSNNSIVCFCPSHYYGDRCQYQSHRLLFHFHIEQFQSMYTTPIDPHYVLKFLILLLFHDQVLITYVSVYRPATDLETIVKKRIVFSYSHSSFFDQQRRQRYANRTDILRVQPYSIRIEAYQLHPTMNISLIAVWNYPIQFDYLPVFRLVKILRWNPFDPRQNTACSSNPCPRHSKCHPWMNDPSRYFCQCQGIYSGNDCSIEDKKCAEGFCAPEALCKPNYRGFLRGNETTPYCICPTDRFGEQCDLTNDKCHPNPCQNGGTCFATSNPDRFTCFCTSSFNGTTCQFEKPHLELSFGEIPSYTAIVIQYFDIDSSTFDLNLVRQEVYTQLPSLLKLIHDQNEIPEIIVARVYSSDDVWKDDLHLLSVQINVRSIKSQTELSELNRCIDYHGSPIEYHQVCQNRSDLLCFRDTVYLCICGENHTHVECFRYQDHLHRCSFCLSNGQCLRGDVNRPDNFICLCPLCHSGRRCQFNSKSFAFTLDQLLHTDLTSHRNRWTKPLLITSVLLTFFIGLPNNLFCYLTFQRRTCLRHAGVAYYLYYLSQINQANLGFFAARLIHLIHILHNDPSNRILHQILCRSLNYFLVSTTRLVYWFSSLIAIERVYITLVLNGRWFQQVRHTRRLIFFTISAVFITNIYQIIFIEYFHESNGSMCIFKYPVHHRSWWTSLHLFVTIMHSLFPLCINLLATVTISFVVVKNKVKTLRGETSTRHYFRTIVDVLSDKKELIIGPALTLIPQLCSLPLLISGFALDCQNLENSRFRHLLMVTYWMAFTPQLTSFFLYISPSTFYSNQWRQTRLYRRFHRDNAAPTIALTVLSQSPEKNHSMSKTH